MTDIYGLILAGGQGKRVGYQDKGLIQIAGKYLVQHVINALSQQVDQIVISANQNIEQYQAFGYKVLTDEMEGFAGPLAGLHRAMEELSTSSEHPALIALAPCDAPLLPRDLVARLMAEYSENKPLAAIPHDGNYLQPLFGIYSTELLPSLEEYLKKGDRKVTIWVESINSSIVDFSDEADSFLNINSEEDLSKAQSALEQRINIGDSITS